MQQSPQMFGMPSQQPPNIISTEQIQKYLDENKQLIMAIMETQNLGKISECAQYQTQLQKNLMYLAAIADAQPPAPTPTPTGPSQPQSQAHPQQQQQQQPQAQPQMPMQSPMLQGSPMQPPQHSFAQQQQMAIAAAYGGARMPFMSQPYDQQLHNMQQQQQQQQQSMQQQQQQSMAGMMGMRMGAPPGMHPSLQMGQGQGQGQGTPSHFMDARNRQDGSEANTGGSQGK